MPRTTHDDIRRLVLAQRRRLGDFAATLDDTAWAGPSLCTGRQVGDVVAHCTQSHVATPWRLGAELIASRFSLTARNQRWVAVRRQHDRSTALTEYQATADRLTVPSAELPYALLEAVIHGYDIAWPINQTIEVPRRAWSSSRMPAVGPPCSSTPSNAALGSPSARTTSPGQPEPARLSPGPSPRSSWRSPGGRWHSAICPVKVSTRCARACDPNTLTFGNR